MSALIRRRLLTISAIRFGEMPIALASWFCDRPYSLRNGRNTLDLVLNKPCTVDPANAEKAICACDVICTGAWITFGGGCDGATCETGC